MKITSKNFTLKNIKGFIQGHYRMLKEDFGILEEHIGEQFDYRLGIMNEECIKNKECPCTCSFPEKQIEDRPCELNCYPPMMFKEDWEIFKKENNITKNSINQKLYERKDILFPA